jgi:Na+/proline symporter
MKPITVLMVFAGYFAFLILISRITSRKADSASFFIGNRKSPWFIVAFGMIGASLSGVTFISVPGWVISSQFAYMQMVLGYLIGYLLIILILLPLYYRLNLTSIYGYLQKRFGFWSYKTGSGFFLISRTIGASARLYIVATVMQLALFDAWGVPFAATVLIIIGLIFLYTYQGGIKTIIWTDTLQTFFMLTALVLTLVFLGKELDLSFTQLFHRVSEGGNSRVWFFDDFAGDRQHFIKYIIGGAFITLTMTGLDQDMMQKNLSCKTLRDSQKNMFWFSLSLVPVNLMFLFLGGALVLYLRKTGMAIPEVSDNLFPMVATQAGLPAIVGLVFLVGLIAAAFSSADSALTSLTTSITVDMLGKENAPENEIRKTRYRVHLILSLVLLSVILLFRALNDRSIIDTLFTLAGFTYGPLLGLYSFGLFTNLNIRDRFVPLIAITAPLATYILQLNSARWFGGYVFSFELLLINGFITFMLLWVSSIKKGHRTHKV